MFVELLRRFDDFRRLDPDTLSSVARHTQLLNVPPARTILNKGRTLHGRFYLLKGRIRIGPTQEVRAGDPIALGCIYPGYSQVVTVTSTQFLHVNLDPIAFLFNRVAEHGLAMEVSADDWELRFLQSPLMQRLPPAAWHEVLSRLTERDTKAGETVIRQGDEAQCCYIVGGGTAVVHRDGKTVGHLIPGDFFGEDALVTDSVRNASVTMLERGRLLVLPERVFRRVLLNGTIQYVEHTGRGMLINVGDKRVPGAVPVPPLKLREQIRLFDPKLTYYVCGGDRGQRALGAFLLTQQGLRAHPLR